MVEQFSPGTIAFTVLMKGPCIIFSNYSMSQIWLLLQHKIFIHKLKSDFFQISHPSIVNTENTNPKYRSLGYRQFSVTFIG